MGRQGSLFGRRRSPVANSNICLACHRAGASRLKTRAEPGHGRRPAAARLDVVGSQSNTYLHSIDYAVNFKATAKENQDAFIGTSADQIHAARDFLMLYPYIRDWPILTARPVLGMGPGGN